MRVLHAFKDYYPPINGGVEKHINQVVHGISGVEFVVLTAARCRKLQIEDDRGVRVVRAPEYARPVSTPVTPSWPKYLRDPDTDLLHFHMPNPFGEMALLGSASKVPHIATFHAEIIGRRLLLPFFQPFQKEFLRRAKRIVVSSPPLAATTPALETHRGKVEVIPFGIEHEKWVNRPGTADAIREKYKGPLILFLGRLSYYKGIEVLIHAMRAIDATCLIVGNGPKRWELERLSQEPTLQNRIFFCGEISDDARAGFYHAADVFVLPSTFRAETYGIAMLEAMACGTPAISTELGTGTSWLNQNTVTGLVVEPGHPEALAAALKDMLKDEVRRSDMGEAAALRVREHFRLKDMLGALQSLYSSV